MKTNIQIVLAVILGAGVMLGLLAGTGLLRDDRPTVRIQRPDYSARPGAGSLEERADFIVEVDANGWISLNGKPCKVEELAAGMKSDDPNSRTLMIRASEKLGWEKIKPIVRTSVEAGINNLTITALTEEPTSASAK